MGIYSHLSEAQLIAKRDELLTKIEEICGGGGVTKIAGEGHILELTGTRDERGLRNLLNEVNRALLSLQTQGTSDYAIGVIY